MLTRREFLAFGAASSFTLFLPGWATGGTVSEVYRLKATCYYPHPLAALPGDPVGETHKGWSDKMTILTEGGKLSVRVNPRDHYLAAIEASAHLDLGALGPDAGRLGLCYYSGWWHAHPWAPHGVGTKMNPLIPRRDFAHGHRKGWPFGTRMEIDPIPTELEGKIRSTMYRGCAFGGKDKDKERNRVDLFVGEPCQYYGPLRARVTFPWSGVSRRPTAGAQEALNILGLVGENGKMLRVDNEWGRNTRHALNTFVKKHRDRFGWGPPEYVRPWDSEIFFVLREVAKEKTG